MWPIGLQKLLMKQQLQILAHFVIIDHCSVHYTVMGVSVCTLTHFNMSMDIYIYYIHKYGIVDDPHTNNNKRYDKIVVINIH